MLISVKTPAEAAIAAATDGVTVVDVKDPSQGSLGFAGAETVNQIAATMGTDTSDQGPQGIAPHRKLVSVALGELQSLVLDDVKRIDWSAIDFVKVGLSGRYENEGWRSPLKAALSGVPATVQRVLVIYADQVDPSAAAQIVNAATEEGLSVVLLDTFDKSNGNVFAHWTATHISDLFRSARRRSMTGVLAGSIGLADLRRGYLTGADLIGVRGAVCDGDRAGSLSRQRLNELMAAFAEVKTSALSAEAQSAGR
jgi:uncharacterized protein (UPF0264 family)